MEAGTTINEPSQLCVLSAIELALIHLIADGIEQGSWALDKPNDLNDSTLTKYLGVEPKIGAWLLSSHKQLDMVRLSF